MGQPRVASRLVSLDLEESKWKLCVKGGRDGGGRGDGDEAGMVRWGRIVKGLQVFIIIIQNCVYESSLLYTEHSFS